MSTYVINQADVFAGSVPDVPSATITRVPARNSTWLYLPVLILDGNTQEGTRVATFEEALKQCTDHADAIDATPIDDRATKLDLINQLAEKDAIIADQAAQISELSARVDGVAEVAVSP